MERNLLNAKHGCPLPLLVSFYCPSRLPIKLQLNPLGVLKRRTPGEVEIIRLIDFIKSTRPPKASEVFLAGLLNDEINLEVKEGPNDE